MTSKNSETKTKFNPKVFSGKARMYRPVLGAPRISKLYIWNTDRKEYLVPETGKPYMARRYEVSLKGGSSRTTQFFSTLDEARKWQMASSDSEKATATSATLEKSGPKLSDVVLTWKKRSFPSLAHGTQLQYEKLLRLHFGNILDLHVQEITPKRVDLWLDELREKALLHPNRMTLDHELMLLSILVKSYLEEEDDLQFHFPIKERHWKASILKRKKKLSSKDFTKEEFFRFRNALNAQGRYGWFYAALATVQYFQALRISEAAALYREDVRFNDRAPAFSRLTVKRSLCWTRRKDLPTYMQIGFKNSDSFEDGVKEQPIFPETHDALQVMFQKNPDQKSGLIFAIDGVPLEYRQIQHAYDYAFKRAGLPYTGTHVLRHGGCRNLYNENGDLSVAQQLLGDKSEQATKVYARRKASALTEVAEAHWQEKVANGVEGGCKWLHEAEKNKKPERHLRVIK